jgi:hypothetical protein
MGTCPIRSQIGHVWDFILYSHNSFEGINIPVSEPISDQCARIFLPADHYRHYVVNKKTTISHRVYNSLGHQFPEGFIPMFFHRCLADYARSLS